MAAVASGAARNGLARGDTMRLDAAPNGPGHLSRFVIIRPEHPNSSDSSYSSQAGRRLGGPHMQFRNQASYDDAELRQLPTDGDDDKADDDDDDKDDDDDVDDDEFEDDEDLDDEDGDLVADEDDEFDDDDDEAVEDDSEDAE